RMVRRMKLTNLLFNKETIQKISFNQASQIRPLPRRSVS
ncbi:hypothetical protein NT04LM_4537, partial [Listeria monocytogenes FSL F2-208]